MGRIGSVILALLVAMFGVASSANAQKRVALVVGNSAYKHAGQLANPKNDATDIAAALKAHGFQVIEGLDLDKVSFERKIRDFSTALKGAEAGLFFYAGHGLQVAGQNYLIPIDAKAESEDALDWEMLKVDLVHRTMERSTNTNILFLDACRDNPLTRNLARAMGTRSAQVGRGLASIESGIGTLISFSTQPGNVAADGTGRNSPFASALVKHLASSGDDLNTVLINVRRDVRRETQGKQVPWEHSSLEGRFYFSGAPKPPEPAASGRLSEATEAWDRTKDATSIAILEAYATRYKDTFYAQLAMARIEELKKQTTAAAKPSAEPKAKSAPSGEQQTAMLQEPEAIKSKEAASSPDGWRPNRPVRLIVPFVPGGLSDLVSRPLASEMGTMLGQTVLVENAPGAGGTVGAARSASAQADGHTIMLHSSQLAATPSFYANPQFNVRTAFAALGLINFSPMAVVSAKDVQARSMSELATWIKANPDKVNYAHAGMGSTSHLCALFLQQKLGASFTQIPYRGLTPAINDLVAGLVQVSCDQSLALATHVKSGAVKAHAVLSPSRIDLLPDVPSASESGYPQLQLAAYNGLYAPAGTPRHIVDAINASLQKTLSQKAVVDALAKLNVEVVPAAMRSPEAHAKHFLADVEQQSQLFKAAGVVPQ